MARNIALVLLGIVLGAGIWAAAQRWLVTCDPTDREPYGEPRRDRRAGAVPVTTPLMGAATAPARASRIRLRNVAREVGLGTTVCRFSRYAVPQEVMRFARENRRWGCDRIAGALANLGHTVSDQTVANVLKRHGLEPAPERERNETWREFIDRHRDVMWATDFFTAEVLTWRDDFWRTLRCGDRLEKLGTGR